MRAVQTVYCTLPFLKEAIERRKDSAPHKIALRIMENLSNIYLDITQKEFMVLVKDNPIVKKLFKRENMFLQSKLHWKDIIAFDSLTDEVCFIHPDYIPDYKTLRKEYGCLIIESQTDIHLIERMNDKRGYVCIVPKEEQIFNFGDAYQDSWDEALKTCKIEPINSLIISDNYIFSKFKTRKEAGLYALLKAIVPATIKIPFHIAIFSFKAEKYLFSEKNAADIIQEIKSLFPGREDDIKVSIIIHTKKITTHDRVIITNYHIITSGAGFSVIEEEDRIAEVAKGYIEPVFHAIATTPANQFITKHFHFQTLEWLKDLYKRKIGTGAGSFIVGDRIHRMLDN